MRDICRLETVQSSASIVQSNAAVPGSDNSRSELRFYSRKTLGNDLWLQIKDVNNSKWNERVTRGFSPPTSQTP